MTSAASVVNSHRRPLPWVIVAASFVVYLGVVVAAGLTGLLLDAPLPWWLAQTAPPLLYALLVLVAVRPRSVRALCGGTLLLWAVHVLLGMLTESILVLLGSPGASGALWVFPPAPLPELLWVPVLLVPLRDLLKGGRVAHSAYPQPVVGRRPLPERRPFSAPARRTSVEKPLDGSVGASRPLFEKPPTVSARGLGATPVTSMVTSMEPRLEATRRPVMASPAAAAPGLVTPTGDESRPADRLAGAGAPAVGRAVSAAPSQTQRLTDELLSRETSDEPLRVSTMRVLALLPAEALSVPSDRLADELRDHPYLSVPRRLVLGQLSEGLVRAGWDLLAPQIPSHLLAMSDDAIKASLPDGHCVLPLDEIVRQLSPDIFLPVGPAPDVRGIEVFPAPFQPLGVVRSENEAAPEVAISPSPIVAASVERELPDQVAGGVRPIAEPTPSVDTQSEATPVLVEPVPSILIGSVVHAPEGGLGARPTEVEESIPTVERAGPAPEPARTGSALRDDQHLLREVSGLLPAVGPLAIDVRVVDGVTLLTATSPGVGADVAVTAAALLLPLIRPGRVPWPVDQITLRGSHAALILTPLGPLPSGGPVLAAAVTPGGGLALLELRCRQAAAAHAARAGSSHDDTTASGEERDEPDLLDVEPSTRTREVASSLGALGTVEASSLRDAETDRALYLFLPPGSDVRAVGGLAHDVSGALRRAAEAGVAFRTAVLRSAARRMVIRLPGGRSDTLVAAGETAQPGLAYRQVEHAAAALGAL